jgi:drug/metabolite transporter (DMT)-like permease
MTTLLLALCTVLLNSGGQILQRYGARQVSGVLNTATDPNVWLALLAEPAVLAGLGCWALSTLLWLYLLSAVEVSVLYAVGSLSYVVVPLAARALLGEAMVPGQWLGMVLIALGVAVGRLGVGGR